VFLEPGDLRWTKALERVAHDVYQTPEYLRVCALQYPESKPRCYLWESEGKIGIIPLLINDCPHEVGSVIGGGTDAVSPYGYGGPILGSGDKAPVSLELLRRFFSEFVVDSKRVGIIAAFLRGHPVLSSACKPFEGDFSSESGTTFGISLSRSLETILSSYRSTFKRVIKKIERVESLRVVLDRWEDIDLFVPVYHQNMNRLHAQSHYFFDLDYFRALQQALSGFFHLMSVFDGERYVGGICFFGVQGIVQYHLPACVDDWRDAGLPKFLIHELVKWGKENNFSVVHLGGGVGGKEDSLAYFKSGFCDMHVPFRTYKLVIDSEKYEAGCRVARKRAELVGARLNDEYFPQYRSSLVIDSPDSAAA
jgi:hypothetical protein